MKQVGINNSQFKQVRYVTGGTSLASGTTYGFPFPTKAGDVIVFSYINAGSPSLSSSTTGITWVSQYTTGGSAPQPYVLIGYNANAGLTSITVSGTASGGGWYSLMIISGLRTSSNPVTGYGVTSWSSSSSSGTTTTFTSTGTNTLNVLVTGIFGSATLTSYFGADGYPYNIRNASSAATRSLATLTSEARTATSGDTATVGWSAAQTGGAIVLNFAHA